jgi:hypothetical protein
MSGKRRLPSRREQHAATMASLFAQTNTATSRTTASADPEGLSSMPSSIPSFLLDTLIALF